MNEILIPIGLVGLIGLVAGTLIALASRFFAVKEDEQTARIREALPGANCGACGYTGCDGYAAAISKEHADPGLCVPGGAKTAQALSQLLGVEIAAQEKKAFVRCSGDCYHAKKQYAYNGMESCAAAATLYGGILSCSAGCQGMGDCVRVCEKNAIAVYDGVARVDPSRCSGCGKCTKVCPKELIQIVPASARIAVACHNTEKGGTTMKQCSAGCIGCRKCLKECPTGAVAVNDFLATIDPEKCTGCEECLLACPRGVIRTI